MAKKLPWGHESRYCARCGKVGPRVFNPTGAGFIHAYCRTDEEKRAERRERAEAQRKAAEKWKAPAKSPTDPGPANMNDQKWPFADGVGGVPPVPLGVPCDSPTAPGGKCLFGPWGWRGVMQCKFCKQPPPDGVKGRPRSK